MLQRQNIFILIVALFGLSACAGSAPRIDPASNESSQSSESSGRASGDYLIGPGDSLDVHVWRHEDLSRVVPVRPDGKISTPLVEDMLAAGKTASALARDIEAQLSEYIKSPKVTIIVSGFIGNANDQIRVIGQAGQPRAIRYTKNMSLLDVMIAVGGLSEFAAPRRSKILRRIDGKGTEIPIRPDLLLERGDIRYDIPMQPGDVLIIPESRF